MMRYGCLAAGFVAFALPGFAWSEAFGPDCLLLPETESAVSTRELGVIETFMVDRGDSVTKGQPLLKLESGVEQTTVDLMRTRANMDAEVEQARLDLEYARRKLNRVGELHGKNMVSLEEQDTAATEAARAEAQLNQVRHQQAVLVVEYEQARRKLDLRTIRSPIDGVVIERLLNVGESVEDRPIIRLAQLDPLSVEVILPAEQFGTIQVGDRAQVTPRLRGFATPRSAEVVVVDRVIDAASDTFGVRLQVDNEGNRIPGGVRCDVRFDGDSGQSAPAE